MGKFLYPWFPPALEAQFRRHYNQQSANVARYSMVLGGIVYCAFFIWDRVVDAGHSLETLAIRVVVAFLIVSVLLVPRRIFVRYLQELVSFAVVSAGLAHVVILSIIKEGFVVGMPGVILVLMYNFVFFRLLFIPSAIGGLLVLTAHDLVMSRYFLPTDLVVAYNFFLVATFVSGATVTYVLEGLFRREFIKTKELDAARAKADGERAKADNLIDSMFPGRVAERLKAGETTVAESHGEATILFSDLVGFTTLTRKLAPGHLVEVLTDYFSMLDDLTEKHGVEKIKTVGDAYMVASGLNYERDNSAEHIADFALDMVESIREYAERHHFPLAMRVGISTGQVVSGVIGLKKPLFDVWGDTVNLASRMESTSEAGQIQISEATYWRLHERYQLLPRGVIEVKGVGSVETYYLTGRKAAETVLETSQDTLNQDVPTAGPVGVAEPRVGRVRGHRRRARR
jgi:adenylate cyclase